jgi:hypothetical protein
MRSLRSFQSNPQELQLIAPPGGYFKLAPVSYENRRMETISYSFLKDKRVPLGYYFCL